MLFTAMANLGCISRLSFQSHPFDLDRREYVHNYCNDGCHMMSVDRSQQSPEDRCRDYEGQDRYQDRVGIIEGLVSALVPCGNDFCEAFKELLGSRLQDRY